MNKTKRILQLVNMLHTRRRVTLQMIKDVCHIPERTAYRYLNTISEANIPVYFDRDISAYTLGRRDDRGVSDLSFGEAALIIFALKVLEASVNGQYQKDARLLLTKVLVRQEAPLETALSAVPDRLTDMMEHIDVSAILSSVLINAAIAAGKKVRFTTEESISKESHTQVVDPRLHFDRSWRLVDKDLVAAKSTDLDSIDKVAIL